MRRLGLWFLLLLAARAQPVATLARIEADPGAFFGREVVLVGYAWPWFRPAPLACRDRPLARGNAAKTRSDGNFCDGTRVAFLPAGVGPRSFCRRAIQLVVRIEPAPGGGWWLIPLRVRPECAPAKG